MHVALTVSPLFDRHGKVIGVSKIARDITARVQQERGSKESRERLRHALEYQEAIISNMGEGLHGESAWTRGLHESGCGKAVRLNQGGIGWTQKCMT